MAQRSADIFIYGLMLAALIGFLFFCAHLASQKTPVDDSIEDHIVHANTYYWFSMAGRGSMAALSAAMKQVDQAQAKFDGLTSEEDPALAARIRGTRKDIRYQQELHRDTFHGVFAWSHFMAKPTLFMDVHATGSFELLDDPDVTAVRNGVNDLIDGVLSQHDVVFVTDPADFEDEAGQSLADQLENEALYLFNLNPRFFVHNMLEVATALNEDEQGKLRRLEPTAEMLEQMGKKWGHRDILVVRPKKIDEVNRHHFWSAQGRLYRGSDPTPAAVYNNYGLCRDRTHMLGGVIFFNALMAAAAIVLFRLLSSIAAHDHQPADWKTCFGLGGIAYLWGRVSVWGLIEVVEGFVPPDETLAIVSFWWPAVTGFVVLIGPAIVMRFAEERFGWLAKSFDMYNRGGAVFAAIAMGSVTYVGQAALWVRTWGGWSVLPPLIIAAVVAAWIIGRALDQTDPIGRSWAIPMIAFAFLIGPAFSHSFPKNEHLMGLWLAAVSVAAVGGLGLQRSGPLIRKGAGDEATPQEAEPLESVPALLRRLKSPPFQETASFQQVSECIEPWQDRKTVRLQIVGPAGIGKTALLKELKRTAAAQHRAAIMSGICKEPTEGSQGEPYQPFADAIAGHFSVNLLMPPQGQLPEIDKAIDGIFEEVVPFSDLLFPPSHGGEGASGSKTELFHSITIMLRQLARKRPVMLVIDDAHWIDKGSAELLDYLFDEFAAGGPDAVAIIIASRSSISGLAASETVRVEKLPAEDIKRLLVDGLNFTPSAAEQLAAAVSEEEGNMHWLFQMINYLADKELLAWEGSGFRWDPKTNLSEHLPEDLLRSVDEMLERHPEFRGALECAACIGPTFTVDVLSHSLGQSRLETIRLLDRIERETGIVRDLRDQDDAFAFRSSFMLEVLRGRLGVNAHGPSKPSPQRIREYHSQLAEAWESTVTDSNSVLFRLATHRYAAGARHADKALENLLDAARAASAQYQHQQAAQFVTMVRECAKVSGNLDDALEQQLLLIQCHRAHVEGTDRVQTAEKMRQWLADHADSDPDVYLAAAQACYDAGIDTRDQQHFANAVAIADDMSERFQEPLFLAQARHFQGIGLPVDQRDERKSRLEEALRVVEQAEESSEKLRLKARIANSLAEQLSYGDDADRNRAQDLFLISIELKSLASIRDVEGLAFAHGGLGRMHFFAPEPDYDTARKHFSEDLRYSEQLGSKIGQTKMHSLIGGCDLKQQRFEDALSHYESARKLAESSVDSFFALAGLLECLGAMGRDDTAAYGGELVKLAEAGAEALPENVRRENPAAAIPPFCHDAIRNALKRCDASRDQSWHRFLTNLLSEDPSNPWCDAKDGSAVSES